MISFETTGEGSSKRVSRRNASIKMLEILKEKFEPLFLVERSRNDETLAKLGKAEPAGISAKKSRKSKAKNIIKIKKTSPEYVHDNLIFFSIIYLLTG